ALAAGDLDAAPPRFGRARLIAGEAQPLAEMPPAIHAARLFREISAQQRHVARDLVPLAALVTEMMQPDVARADGQAVAAADFVDAVLHVLVNDAFEANARIVAEQTQLRIGRPTHARKKPQPPASLAFVGE